MERTETDSPHVAALRRAIQKAGGTQAKLAERMRPFVDNRKPSQQLICYWLSSEIYLGPEWWEPIEKATDGAVTRRDLRPDISWQ